MKRTLLVLLVAVAVGAAVLAPVLIVADVASCSVTSSSYADSVLNPSKGEDTEFFVSTGGVPNIMFVLDTSGSMQRLPPDGASLGWGSFEAAGNATAGAGYGCTNSYANTRVYASPCGTTTVEGAPFNPTPGVVGPDFAQAKDSTGAYCPYMTQGNQAPKTDKPGFDPDFYNTGGGNPWFFEPTKVYHDNILIPVSTSDGWSDWSTTPASYATTTDFCAQYSADATKQNSCNGCMRDQGYFFDGGYFPWQDGAGNPVTPSCANTSDCKLHNAGTCIRDTGAGTGADLEYSGNNDNKSHCRIPHVWFSGNFLNFYPPKFIIARKVLKDVLQAVRKVRLGLTVFDSGGDGGNLLEKLNPGCNMLGSPSSFDSNRSSIKNAINNKNSVTFSGFTPLAETLLNVGELYRTQTLPWFDSTFQNSSFEDATPTSNNKSVCFSCQASAVLVITDGLPTRDGKIPGPSYSAAPMTLALANTAGTYAGQPGYNITGISATDCPVCDETRANSPEAADTTIANGTCLGQQASGACDDAGNPVPSWLPKVAWYLKNLDFRSNTETGADGLPLSKKQSVTTYTIGLGTRGNASLILQDTADAGGGLYNGGSGTDVTDAKTLRDAIMKVLEDVNTRSTSFGAASLSTLQIASSQGVLIPRFEPSRNAHWDGHLFSFDLYSEFTSTNGNLPAGIVPCREMDPSVSGPANGDYDCDGKCQSVFLMDKDGHFIQEDSTGAFKKNLTRTLAACGGGSQCSAARCSIADPAQTALAVPFWDAGSKLAPVKSYTDPVSGIVSQSPNPDFTVGGPLEWNRRALYTVIDDHAPFGQLDSSDTLVDLRTVDPATLVPYLNIKGNRFCSKLSGRLTSRGNTAGATIDSEVATGVYTACAKAILDYARGADIFNERACSGFPGTICTRAYQLGDIFHSSPIEVWPPFASDGLGCIRGWYPQCMASLFSASIPQPSNAGNANAYDDYAKNARYKSRRKFALAGANDGMLHAFQIERYVAGTTNLNPRAGEEIWAFIPPDLLPKLRLLTENVHQFYVDATPMVRDVWMDGIPNRISDVSGSATADGVRHAKEFHTIAVVGERRGGTHYFALDVTDASDELDAKPKFMWLYPQPTDPEELLFGETYAEFVPKPPPIGPVRLDAGPPPCAGSAQQYQNGAAQTRCFTERWIVFLSGGFDPQYTKGRGVHMVALDSGKELWDFSQPSGPASLCDSTSDPRCHLNYPVTATVGMMMWGKQANFLSQAAVDGYFDTATFGDIGGQLWTLRFNDPGIIDGATGKVNNWFGARAFQHGLNASTPACGLGYCQGQPFFYITSNLPLAANGLYRTLAGTGDRFNLLDPVGGTCGPDNIRACLLKGCTVSFDDGSAAQGAGAVYGVEPLLGTQSYKMELAATCSSLDPSTYRYDVTAPSGAACTTITSKLNGLRISCPSAVTCSGVDEATTKSASVVCTSDSCDASASNTFGIPIDTRGNPDKLNWFFSVQVFEQNGGRQIFRTLDQAKAYDAARLKEGDLKNVNAADYSNVASNLGTADDRGWSYFFDHGAPSPRTAATIPIAGVDHNIYRTDERNASVSTVTGGCSLWNTMQTGVPVGALDPTTNCPVNSPCKAGRAQVSYLYGASPSTGGLCLQLATGLARSQKNETLVPPHIGTSVMYISQNQMAQGQTTVRVPQGGANIQIGAVQDLVAPVQWLPVDRDGHACRHALKENQPGYTGPPSNAACK